MYIGSNVLHPAEQEIKSIIPPLYSLIVTLIPSFNGTIELWYTVKMKDFVIHACEQSLRFSTGSKWEDLSDKLKMQLSFNVGVMALGLDLPKEQGY